MPKTLIDDLGENYVREWCTGAFFQTEPGSVYLLRNVYEDFLDTKQIVLNSEGTWKSARLPLDTLTSLANFEYPKLGYRQLEGKHGPIVHSVSNRRSARRGLRLENISAEPIPVYYAINPMMYDPWHEMDTVNKVRMIYSPTFTSFAEGVKMLLDGSTLAFAVSEDIAVTMSYADSPDVIAHILFRDKKVGEVTKDGVLSLHNKILQRASLRRKLEE